MEPIYDTEDMFNYYAWEARRKGIRQRDSGTSHLSGRQQALWNDPMMDGDELAPPKKTKKVIAPKAPVNRKANKKKNTGAIVDGVRIIDID